MAIRFMTAARAATATAALALATFAAAAPASATTPYEDALSTLVWSLPSGYDTYYCDEIYGGELALAGVHCQATDSAPEGYYYLYGNSYDLDSDFFSTLSLYDEVYCPEGGGLASEWTAGGDPYTTAGWAACVNIAGYAGSERVMWSNYNTGVLGIVEGWTLYDQYCWWIDQPV
jgi:hypothetical protein